jgi:hypothetical protein
MGSYAQMLTKEEWKLEPQPSFNYSTPSPRLQKKNLAITQLWCWMTLNTIGYPNHNEREETKIILKYETK